MERKNIAFQYGIHRSPSAANDGELAECINLEVHNGELTPSVMPQVSFTLNKGEKLLFIHKTGNYKNYIIQKEVEDNGKSLQYLCWFSDTNTTQRTNIKEITPTSIHSVGNTLVVLSKDYMEYILFKSGDYKCIGSKPPFCSISFGLRPADNRYIRHYETIDRDEVTNLYPILVTKLDKYIAEKGDFTFDLKDIYEDNESTGLNGRSEAVNLVNKFTELYHTVLNRARSASSKTGHFSDSFYIRYAYRMYDGSHYMHSAPCFFPICTDGYPSLAVINPTVDTGTPTFKSLNIGVEVLRLLLDYEIIGFYNEGGKVSSDILVDWEDIIDGIDIFVTDSISRIDAESNVYGFSNTDYKPSGILYCGKSRGYRETNSDEYVYNDYNNTSHFYLNVEKEDDDVFFENIKTTSLFYKIASFKSGQIQEFTSKSRTPLTIKEDTLTNLEQQEVLVDDYDSHNGIIPSFAHVYNGRLNISGIRTKLFSGFPMESMVPYTYDSSKENHFWYVSTKLEIEGREVTVVSESNVKLLEKPAFIYYPNAKAKKFTLNRYNGTSGEPGYTTLTYYTATFNAEPHKLLNGSFYLSPSYGISDEYKLTTSSGSPQPSGDPYLSYPNKIYTSEVNNPFFFPLAGRNSIGTGEIVAITSNTKAISPGQFGEYPLIVFSTDGVWAMQTGEEGLYYSVHPISKDICINPNVLQTDGPVLFVTDNGLHSLAGDSVQNISMHIKGKPESITIPSTDGDFAAIAEKAKDTDTFNQFIKDAVFAYDYANSRVLAYNEKHNFAYVIATDSGMITKLVLLSGDSPVVMSSAIQAYPEVYMQSGNDIYTFVPDKDNTGAVVNGVLVTRTMTFGDPLVMKVINDVRLLYHQSSEASQCRYAMYVSNDGYNWAQRTSLRGHSFKYFRFVCFAELADTDALQGMSIMFDYRKSHKLR